MRLVPTQRPDGSIAYMVPSPSQPQQQMLNPMTLLNYQGQQPAPGGFSPLL
jgi:hypothetical protein